MSHSFEAVSASLRIGRFGAAWKIPEKDFSALKLRRNGGQPAISSITASEISDAQRELFLKFDL